MHHEKGHQFIILELRPASKLLQLIVLYTERSAIYKSDDDNHLSLPIGDVIVIAIVIVIVNVIVIVIVIVILKSDDDNHLSFPVGDVDGLV